jgi:hypothetical protein
MTTNGSHVNTNGTTVTWVSGNKFVAGTNWDGQLVEINNQYYTVTAPAGNPATLTGLTLTTTAGTQSNVPFFPGPSVTSSFGTSDWVLRLLPIQYNVDVSNASDPRLMRTQAGTATAVMDQVIGFKVGAAWWNNNVSTFQYEYNSSNYYNDYTLVRAVRVSLIGRTSPSTQPGYQYRNPFDSGPYQIRGNSIVVNPRSLTMNND